MHGQRRGPASSGATAAVAVTALLLATLGPVVGLLVSVATAPVAATVVIRAIRAQQGRLTASEVAALPGALDLIRVALLAGQPVPDAVDVGASACSPRLATRLTRVAGSLRLGAAPADAWRSITEEPELQVVGQAAVRSADSGIALAAGFGRAATAIRDDQHALAIRRAERIGVWAVAPLGLCFLPAFACIGIAPVIVGIARPLLSGGAL